MMDKVKEKKAELFDLIREREMLNSKVAQVNQIIQQKLKELEVLENDTKQDLKEAL